MAEMGERFQQILSRQQMDKKKVISQILQEVSPCPGCEGGGGAGGAQGTWSRAAKLHVQVPAWVVCKNQDAERV